MFGIVVPPVLIRNFMMFGIPFFGIGLLVRKHLDDIILPKSNNIIWLFLILDATLSVVSRLLFGLNELYMGSLFILLGLVILALKYADRQYPRTVIRVTTCSTNIYIFHPLINECLKAMYTALKIQYRHSIVVQMLHPLAVCLITTLLAFGISLLQERIGQQKIKA